MNQRFAEYLRELELWNGRPSTSSHGFQAARLRYLLNYAHGESRLTIVNDLTCLMEVDR